MGHGGARAGAGLPKGTILQKTISKQEEREMLRAMLRPHIAEVASSLVEKAKDKDIAAIKEFFERLLGKVIEEVDLTSGGQPIVLPATLIQKYVLNSGTRDNSIGPTQV